MQEKIRLYREVVKLKKIAIIVVSIGLVLGLGRLGIHVMSKNLAERVIVNNVELVNLTDGEYQGTFSEGPLEVEVKVIIKENAITDIQILKHEHGLGSEGEKIIANILEEQSLEVDTISGATASSKVILKAVEEAMLKAK